MLTKIYNCLWEICGFSFGIGITIFIWIGDTRPLIIAFWCFVLANLCFIGGKLYEKT